MSREPHLRWRHALFLGRRWLGRLGTLAKSARRAIDLRALGDCTMPQWRTLPVEARWRDDHDNEGVGTAVSLSGDTGYFWFFDPKERRVGGERARRARGQRSLLDLLRRALERAVRDHGDRSVNGSALRYFNPLGDLASLADTTSFDCSARGAAGSGRAQRAVEARLALVDDRVVPAAAVPCVANANRLCLNNGRFGLEVAWKDFQGHTGKGTAVSLTGDTGYFWFFNSANVELVSKMVDGRPVNGKFWVFYGALSNVEYTLTVTDSVTGQQRTYRNPQGRLASVADTGAF